MARTSFYNDNRFRRYPFVSTAAIEADARAAHQVPDSLLVGCGFKALACSGFVTGTHSIWLSTAGYDSDHVTLQFSSDAPGLAAHPLIFTVPRNGGETVIAFADSLGIGVTPVSGGCVSQPLWMGFVVVGSTEEFVNWALSNPYATEQYEHTIEPCLIQNLDQSYVRSVSLANQKRVQTTDVPGAIRPLLISAQCIQGPIRFQEGYNCNINYDLADNALVFSAGVGDGDGEPCGETPMIPDEASPDGGQLLSGGPSCNETIKSINGVAGPFVSFRGIAGGGIAIAQDASNPHQINVTIEASLLASLGINT